MDDAAWAALTLSLTVAGRSGPGSPSGAAGWRPACAALASRCCRSAAYLTKTLQMFTGIVGEITDWAGHLVFNPFVWPACSWSASRSCCSCVSGMLSLAPAAATGRRAAATTLPEPAGRPKARSRRSPATTTWPRSRRSCARAASPEWARLRRAQPAVVAPRATPSPSRASRCRPRVVRGRPRRLRRQRRRPGPPGRRQADPGRLEVAARAGADRAGRSPTTASTASWPTRCARRSGCTSRASATTSSSPTRPSTGARSPSWSPRRRRPPRSP